MDCKIRDKSFDIAKGIGIILVVIGHTDRANSAWIYAFHMPLFFVLSGFFLKMCPFREFAYKRFRSLFVPLVVFYLLSLMLKVPFRLLTRGVDSVVESAIDGNLFYLTTVDVTLWYIVCLLMMQFLWFVLCKYIRNGIYRALLIFVIFIGGYYLSKQFVSMPIYITQAFICLPFMFIGQCYNKNKHVTGFLLFVISFFCYVLSYKYLKPDTDILCLRLGTICEFLLPALSGSFMVIGLSHLMVRYCYDEINGVFSSLGKYSLFIMALSEDVRVVSPLCKYGSIMPYGDKILEFFLVMIISYGIGVYVKMKFPIVWGYRNA